MILEAGEINVEFEKDEKRISGTPINDLFYKDYIRPLYQVRVLTEPQNRKRAEAMKPEQWTTKDEAEYRRNLPNEELENLRKIRTPGRKISARAGRIHEEKEKGEYPGFCARFR